MEVTDETRGRPRAAKLLGLAALLIPASGAGAYLLVGDASAPAAPGSQRVEVTFDEWTVELQDSEIPAGRTTFLARNAGDVDHEMLILATDAPPGELPLGLHGVVGELAGEYVIGRPHRHTPTNDSYAVLPREPEAKIEDHLRPGDERAFVASLRPGRYAVYCNLIGHYARGQWTGLTVTPAKEGS